jgi:hypothetical protein
MSLNYKNAVNIIIDHIVILICQRNFLAVKICKTLICEILGRIFLFVFNYMCCCINFLLIPISLCFVLALEDHLVAINSKLNTQGR